MTSRPVGGSGSGPAAQAGRAAGKAPAASQPLKGRDWWTKDFGGLLEEVQAVRPAGEPTAPASGAASAPPAGTAPQATSATRSVSAPSVASAPPAASASPAASAHPAASASPAASAPPAASVPPAQAPWWKQDFEGIFGDTSGSPPPPPPLSPRVQRALKAYAEAAATGEREKGRLDTRA